MKYSLLVTSSITINMWLITDGDMITLESNVVEISEPAL
jgi:hypothetical protein